MTAFTSIPIEMKEEVLAGVNYIKTLLNRFQKLNSVKIELFGEKLTERLCQKYTGHWYPEKPMKGKAYRCIRINKYDKDDSILEACAQSGLKFHELALPKEITLWIDPFEVSCRLGEEGYPYTVASFDPRTARAPDVSPTPEEDSSACSSSFSQCLEEDSDSGVDARSDGSISPPVEEQISWNRTADRTSQAMFRTPSPLWIPAWRAPKFYPNLQTNKHKSFWT